MHLSAYSAKKYFQLPDLTEGWPFIRTINPHFHEVAPSSADWIDNFNAFSKKRRIAFRKANFGLISSLAYPHASPAHLRTGCDLMNAFFVFDDISDDQCAADVRKEAMVIMDALR
jgi:Delta6-protoilludene synthase